MSFEIITGLHPPTQNDVKIEALNSYFDYYTSEKF